jgi:hypothetical protein
MSDLTRYSHPPTRHLPVEATKGQWVRAEEAEARIKELEAALETEARLRVKDCEERNAYKARLRAADELADALEEVDAVYGNFELELTAYREASK